LLTETGVPNRSRSGAFGAVPKGCDGLMGKTAIAVNQLLIG